MIGYVRTIVPVVLDDIDWPLLREQKAWLVEQRTDEAIGLLHLLDALMDQAADKLGSDVVFGPDTEE